MVVTHNFKRQAGQLLALCILAGSLSACGGGGGNPGTTKVDPNTQGRDSSTPGVQTGGVLTFETPTVTATVESGRSSTITVNAILTNPQDFNNVTTAYAFFIDSTGVIQSNVQVSQTGTTSYRAVMQTVPALAVGNHKGNFVVKVCRDSDCAQQFPGSPMNLPYDITVKAAGG